MTTKSLLEAESIGKLILDNTTAMSMANSCEIDERVMYDVLDTLCSI